MLLWNESYLGKKFRLLVLSLLMMARLHLSFCCDSDDFIGIEEKETTTGLCLQLRVITLFRVVFTNRNS